MFTVSGVNFQSGDIVEKHDGSWRYWTTIHTRADAVAAVALGTTFYRVVRGPTRQLVS